MTTVLLTGFEPFAGAASNPSWDAVERVAQTWSGDAALVIELLPVTFGGASASMRELIARHSPDVVIGVGLAEGRDAVTPERVAINVEDARIADNDGDQPIDRSISPDGPAAYFSGLPIRDITARIREAGIPSRVSDSAGTYVCNSLMYSTMQAVEGTDVMAGFIHVPCSPELAVATGLPALSVDDIARALVVAIDVSLDTRANREVRPSAFPVR
ncbi:MAG TPA: pyroglutamyl-peptidase I [Galbitalea sp.]|jgi:pyroglutamyl-peptidase|nr:pyroglutamyl-peptidase I [Galbitalea sp.]